MPTIGGHQLTVIAASLLLLGTSVPASAQELPPGAILPTVAANPPHNDVWIWVEQPLGSLPPGPVDIRFWAFRCGGTITAVKPSTMRTGPLTHYTTGQPRPDIVTAMASKCSAIPTNIGYTVTMDLSQLPSHDGPSLIGYSIDVEVTDDLGRKTMLRQSRGAFTIR